jgi:tryptophanyl-tRNA synthetase
VCAYYKIFAPTTADDVADKCRSARWGCTDCKRHLAEVLTTFLSEPRKKRADLEAHPDRLREVLAEGATRARAVAQQTMDEVKALVGLGKL